MTTDLTAQHTAIDDPRDPRRDEPITAAGPGTPGTTVRYVGSIEAFRGLYGWVEQIFEMTPGDVRYVVEIVVPNAGVQTLAQVRRQSLIVGENLG